MIRIFSRRAIVLGSVLLGGCASPYFVHDPRSVVVDRAEVPRLLKSLRCELATYIAANNQHNVLFTAEAKVHGIRSAIGKYQYYEIDPALFGAVNLQLQIQDNLGLTSATQYEYLRPTGTGSQSWTFGPIASDQSTYGTAWGFVIPQDAIMLQPAPPAQPNETNDQRFSCYSTIPKRVPAPFHSRYAEEDLDALARNDFPDYALFRRVWVNNTIPLAAWLLDVGNSITGATLSYPEAQQKPSHMIPAQMQFQFEVVVTGGLNVTYGLISPLWPIASTGLTGGVQKTNTIQIYLNGVEAANWYNAPFGGAKNDQAKKLPVISVVATAKGLPDYVGRTRSRGHVTLPVIVAPSTRH
ncbi:MAG: hypothetical protein WBF58_21740 [Xanthobacteraceae bacterium]